MRDAVCGLWVSGFGFRVAGYRFLVSGFGFRVYGVGCRVQACMSWLGSTRFTDARPSFESIQNTTCNETFFSVFKSDRNVGK